MRTNYLGIWHPKCGEITFDKEMFKMGFNSYRIPVSPFWKEVENLCASYEDKQKATAKKMFEHYLVLKEIGYVFFLVDFGWGLGKYDQNWFYKVIYDEFKDCEDVFYDFGEFYEDYVETEKIDEITYESIMKERKDLIGDKLWIGATSRNKDKLGAVSLTSYWNQKKYWRATDKFVWIYGQLKFDADMCYENLSKVAKELGINKFFLYQGDPKKFDIAVPYTWLNSLLRLFGKDEKYEKNKREKFIKSFKLREV